MELNTKHKNLIGGLTISSDPIFAYSSNYFSDTLIFGIKGNSDTTVIEASRNGVVNIPDLNYYVNAYTLSYNTNNTNVETNVNFISAYSTYIYPYTDYRTDYLSYRVAIMAYTLPTKHYVDKLLELKDALLYRGTLTPATSSGNSPGIFQATHVENSEIGSMGYTYTSAGSVYKVDSTGYFGNTLVHAGDMIISYRDDAKLDTTEGWNVIEMHISHDNTSVKQINPEFDAENRLLSNVRILHDGMLTYTYVHLLENEYSIDTDNLSETSRKYVEYINVHEISDSNDIYVSYYTKILKFNNTGVRNDGTDGEGHIDTFGDDSYRFITNIYQDIDGHLSYTYVDVKTYSHHNTYCLGEFTETHNNGDELYIINSIRLDDTGGLYYSYRNATIKNSDIMNTWNFDISNTNTASDGAPVITGISMTPDGQLAYSWGYIYDPHDDHSTVPLGEVITSEDYPKYIINEVFLDQDGKFYYTYRDATITADDISHTGDKDISNSNSAELGLAVITGIHMTSDGQLSYNWSYVYDPHDDHGTYTVDHQSNPATEDVIGDKYIINNVYLNEDGWLSYSYRNATILESERQYNSAGNKDISNTDTINDGIKVITGINMTSDGQLSYCYSYIYDPHDDHTTINTGKVSDVDLGDDDIEVVTSVDLASDGTLSYNYKKIIQPSLNENKVRFSLFVGDNDTTYMMKTTDGVLEIIQPIIGYGIYGINGDGITYHTDGYFIPSGTAYLGDTYNFDKLQEADYSFGYEISDQKLYIEYYTTITGEYPKISSVNDTSNFTYAIDNKKYVITLGDSIKQTVVNSSSGTNNTLTGTITKFGNLTFTDSIAAKNYKISIAVHKNPDGKTLTIDKNISLPAKTISKTITPYAHIYQYVGNSEPTVGVTTYNNETKSGLDNVKLVSGKPSSVTFNRGGKIYYIFPACCGTPKFKQLNTEDTNWINTNKTINLNPKNNTTLESGNVQYKIYTVQINTKSGGTWELSWS
jgi:hypothetical protein